MVTRNFISSTNSIKGNKRVAQRLHELQNSINLLRFYELKAEENFSHGTFFFQIPIVVS